MDSSLVSIPEYRKDKREWRLSINGELYDGAVATLELVHPRFGSVSYGDDPTHEFDAVCIKEPSGGQQILPFSILPYAGHPRLYVGVLSEWRRNQGREVLNAPRGYRDSHFEELEKRLHREGEDICHPTSGRIFRLPGKPINFNSSWAVTCADEGFDYFAFEVEPMLARDRGGNLIFSGVHGRVHGVQEKVFQCRFIPWNEALQLEDNFTVAGVGRLMLHLINAGRANCLR